MPAELKDQLDAAAAENKRSLTAEIVARLTEVADLRDRLRLVEREEAIGGDPKLATDVFRTALSALEKAGMMLRHKDVYTREAEEWRFIRPFVISRDPEILAAIQDADVQRAAALARAKTPAGEEPPAFATLMQQEVP